jgi:hypothetical protein
VAVRPWLPASGRCFGVVLEIEFLSRTIASKPINDRSLARRSSPKGLNPSRTRAAQPEKQIL